LFFAFYCQCTSAHVGPWQVIKVLIFPLISPHAPKSQTATVTTATKQTKNQPKRQSKCVIIVFRYGQKRAKSGLANIRGGNCERRNKVTALLPTFFALGKRGLDEKQKLAFSINR